LGFGVWGLGFGVWGLGFGVWGLGFGVWGLGFGVWGFWRGRGAVRAGRRSAGEEDVVVRDKQTETAMILERFGSRGCGVDGLWV
jgi:hypothetical protein